MKLQLRISWVLGTAFGVILALVLVEQVLSFRRQMAFFQTNSERAALTSTAAIAQSIDREARLGSWESVQDRLRRLSGLEIKSRFRVVAPDGAVLADSGRIQPDGQVDVPVVAQALADNVTVTMPGDFPYVLLVAVPLSDSAGQPAAALLGEVDWEDQFSEAQTNALVNTLAAGLSAIVAFAATIALVWGLIGLPLERLRRLAEAVNGGVEEARVPTFRVAELEQVGTAFNQMLDRVVAQRTVLEMRNAELSEANSTLEEQAAERKRVEEELRKHRYHLEELVEERTTALMRSVEHLEREITERRQAGETLRQRNRELALLNRASQALTSTLDLDQVLVTVLGEVRHLLGVVASSVWLADLETDELVCQHATGPQSEIVRGWRLVPGEGLAGWVARSGEGLIVPDAQVDGRHFKEVDQQTGLPLRSILGVPLRIKKDVIGVLQVMDTEVNRFNAADLTLLESLAAPAAIAIDNARLVEALRQRTFELQARNEDLDAYAHTVAHDLKGPLALVVGLAEVLGEECATMPGEERRRYLHKMAQSGRKMNNIVDELLLLAGVRQMEVEMEPLDMASIVAEAQRRLAYVTEERQAEVISPETWPVALGYGPWVEEVWVNYLSNAIKYGGQPPRVELGAMVQADDTVCFWVRDNGSGFTPEEQARLFKPFTRFDQVRAKGHGLGLSIVRRIVEKLGGQVRGESEVGRGSVFSFTLPAMVA